MKTYLGKKYHLTALHELPRQCGRQEIGVHGHDYEIEVVLKGDLQKNSQWLISRDTFDQVVQQKILMPYNRTFLNRFFAKTSGEALCNEFFKILKDSPLAPFLHQVNLQETRKNRFMAGDLIDLPSTSKLVAK